MFETIREQLIDHFNDEYNIEIAESGEEALEFFNELLEQQFGQFLKFQLTEKMALGSLNGIAYNQ